MYYYLFFKIRLGIENKSSSTLAELFYIKHSQTSYLEKLI